MKDYRKAETKVDTKDAKRVRTEARGYTPARGKAHGASETGSSAKLGGRGSSGNKSRHHRYGGFRGTALVVLLTFSMVFASVLGAFADDLVNTVPNEEVTSGSFYGDQVNTYFSANGMETKYDTPGYGPYAVDGVLQSRSATSATSFAAGLPLGTIFIDQSKIGEDKGTTKVVSSDENIIAGLTVVNGKMSYDGRRDRAIKMEPSKINRLDGDLFTVTFEDAAILPNGTRADLVATYSNARILVDQRYASAPAGEQYYHGAVYLAQGNAIAYGGTDTTNFNSNAVSYRAAAAQAVDTTVKSLTNSEQGFTNGNSPTPSVGLSIDISYQILNKDKTPAAGTFVFAICGINLDRDPDKGTQNNVGKTLWYSYTNSFGPEAENGKLYSYFTEAMEIRDGQISDNVYVRPNNALEDNPAKVTGLKGSYYYANIARTADGNLKFIGNDDRSDNTTSYSGHDDSYNSGFVTLADAANGFKVTATGHGNSANSMNSKVFNSKQIWYRYTDSSGPHGKIQTTNEGNWGGKLNDGGEVLTPDGPYDYDAGKPTKNRATYVVAEGKTVTYTMTPDIGYKASRVLINGREVKINGEAVSSMKKGDSVTVTTAAGKEGTLKYEEDGTYTFIFPYALSNEDIHVDWEPTTADLYIAKIWKDNNDEDGLRSLIYGGSDKPKFKLQYSTNGGRNWIDVKTGETKNSDIANTPIHPERTYADQEVPDGKVGGAYKDGTYYINNGTSGSYKEAATQPVAENLVPTYETCQSKTVMEDTTTRKRYVEVGGTYKEVEKADHPFTWEHLPVYTYDDSGTADRPITYRIVEDPDPVHRDYKKAQYFDSQAFELTSEKSKTWNGWQIYKENGSDKYYVLKGDGLYYLVSSSPFENADGVVNQVAPTTQPDKNNLTPISSNTYRTTDKAIPYQSEEILNEHTVRKLYVDVNKFWNDRDLLDATTTEEEGNKYKRVDLKFILSGETEDDEVDLNGDAGGKKLELTVSPTETGAKYEKIDDYQLFKDTLGNQYANVIDHSTAPNGYYPVSEGSIDYTKAADVNPLDLSPIIYEKYKVDDDRFGVCFNELPTHYNGKKITYTVKEQFKIGDTWYDAGESEVSWVTNGGELNPERDSSHEVKGYETIFSNTPRIENKYNTLPITIAKRDAKTTNVLLEGAEFTIYRNAITEEKALDNDDVKIEGQKIYTHGSLEYVLRKEAGDTEENYYTFSKKNDGTYEYTLANPQPKETDLKVKQGDVKSNVVYTSTQGLAMVEFQEPGTYYIKETKAPTGYTADPTIYAFIVNEDLKTITLEPADDDHATSWWKKLYDMLFRDGEQPITYDNWNEETSTLTVDDEPLSANILVRKTWEDNDDQDGVRPKDKLEDGQTDNPKTPKVILQWTTTAHTAEGLPVYTSGTKSYVHNAEEDKYYEVIEEDTIGTFDSTPVDPQPENVTETSETCQGRKVYKDGSDQKYVFVDEKYHKVTVVDKTGSVSGTEANPQPNEDELELIQDSGWTNVIIGTEDPGDPDPEYAIERVSYAGGPVKTSQTDAYTWSNVKAYRDGKVVVYRVHETSPLIDDKTYSIKYSHTSDTHEKVFTLVNQNGTTHNQTVDVTNKHETRVINIEAYKTWNDEDTTKRREATLTLWKEVNGARSIVTKMENGVAVNDTGTVPITDETDPVKTWSDLPAYEMGYPITYSIVETTIDGYKTVYEVDYTKAAVDPDPAEQVQEEGDSIDASVVERTYYTQADKDAGKIPTGKKVGDESTTAAFRIENEETINIDVEKTWVDGANANVTFELWRTTTPEADWNKSKFKEETICYQHNETGNRISVKDYDALPATDKENYTEQKGKNWSPYEDSTETTTVDGWKKVDSYEFAASRFKVSSTGETKDYTFKNLPRQEVEVIDGKKIFKDGANNKFAFNETDKKYYAVNSDGTISDTPANPQPTSDSLSLSYLKYTYRILETPKLVRLAADQTEDFKVTNYNLHASSGFANVEVVKELQGREWNAGGMEDKFYFELDPQSATDTTDPTHSISVNDIPLPTRTLSRDLLVGTNGEYNGKYYVKDADDMYREVTEDTSTTPSTYTVADTPVNPQPKYTDLTDTGTTCEASVQYAVDSTKTKEVGAIGRAADFKSIEFSDETVIPRGHTVEFNYKVREVFDLLGTSLADATNNTGKRDGISYADFDDQGSWTQAEHDLKIIVVNDLDGKMTTTILWDGATETSAVPVFTNKYSSESEAKAWIEKEIANRPWVDYADGKGDAFQFEVLAISGSQLNVPGADHSQGTDDSYTSKPLISNALGNPQDDIQKQSETEYAFGLTGNKYTGDMLNSSGEGYFIYAIGEKDKATSKDDDLGLNEYKVDGLTYDDSIIYAKVKVTDNWDGTLSFDVKYYSDAACRHEITTYKVWIQDKFTGGRVDQTAADPQPTALIETTEKIEGKTVYADANGNRYVKDGDPEYYHEIIGGTETKRLLSQEEIAAMGSMSGDQIKANGYVEKNVAHFINRETVDIPVVKEWKDGPAIEDVNLHLVRHLYEMNDSFKEDDLTYDKIKADAEAWDEDENGPFWTTEGYTHIAKRGEFLKEDGTPDYDQGSSDTTTRTYENIDKFNKDLPKYVKKDGKMYRAVYKLVEDNTSDTYTTTYRSSKEGEEDTEGNAIFLGGETLTVTNTVTATNVAKIAAVKQFLGRNWASTDKFDFTLEPVGIGIYDKDTGALTGINDTTGKAKVPMPARYVNNNDPTDVKSISEYDKLPDDQKANYTKVRTDSADAISDDEEVDKNGHLERLASFDEIFYTVNDLQYDPVEKHYQGDFYYIMKEKLPEITADLYPVAYTSSTQTTEKAIDNKQLPTMASGEKLKTVKFSNGITYDCDEHNVHVKVRENRTGKLQTQIAYDYDDFKDISTGTQYTPVYTNRYDATGEYAEEINKYIMGRRWKDGESESEEEEQQDKFDFRMTPLAGAPFEDADKNEFPAVDTHSDDERDTDLEAGDAIHSVRGAHVKRLKVTDEDKEIQVLTMPKLKYRLSELGKTVEKAGDLKYSNGTDVPAGMAYDQFVYSFEETNDYLKKYGKDVKDLNIDSDTEYARVTVIDKGDGTLDHYVEIFEDRYCEVRRYIPGTETPATSPTFVNQLKRDLSITKAWADTPNSDVTMRLKWSVDGTHWYDADKATFLVGQDVTKTIKKDATGDALTVTWTDLPAYANIYSATDQTGDDKDMNDVWIYYTITEDPIDHVITRYSEDAYEEGDSYNDSGYEEAVNDVNPFKTEDAPSGDSYADRTYNEIIDQLYATNWREETEGTAQVGVVKQYIGKVWEDEEFTFEMNPVKSRLGGATSAYTTYEDQVEAHASDPKVKVMPVLSNNKATANTGTAPVSVNEHAANFNGLVIKLSDLVVDPADGKEKGEFIYEIKEVIPDGAVEMTEGGKTYFVKKDEHGNIIKYTTDTHTAKIIAVDDGSGKLDITVSYDTRNAGEFVPVYTNYAMMPTPIDGTKTWIGGKKAEHQNGTVELDEETGEIKTVPAPTDKLGLTLKRKLVTSDGDGEPVTHDDAGRKLVVVWVKENPAQPEKPTGYWINSETEEKITDAEYQLLSNDEKENYTQEMTPAVPESIDAQTGDDPTSTEKGNSGPYTYTIKAEVTEGGVVTGYEDPLLNVCNTAGYEYEYYITETSKPKGYEKSESGMDVVNTNSETDNLKVSKTWDDAQGVDGTRPDKVIVHLYKDVIVPAEEGGQATTKTVQVEVDKKTITRQEGDDKDVWSKGEVFEDLPLYDNNGNVIKYFVLEEGIGGYTATYAANSTAEADYKDENNLVKIELDGQKDRTDPESETDNPQFIDIKNSLTPATNTVKVTKVWDDQDDIDGARPDDVTFQLYKYVWDPEANSGKGAYKTTEELVTGENGTGRPATQADVDADKAAKGEESKMKVGDIIKIEDLTLDGTADDPTDTVANETAPTNTYTWNGEWINLPLTENGKTILYIIKEVIPEGADSAYGEPGTQGKYSNDPCIRGDQIKGYTATNTYTPEVTSFEGIKEWVDGDSSIKHNNSADLPGSLTLYRTTAAPGSADWDDESKWINLGTLDNLNATLVPNAHVDWSSSSIIPFFKPDDKFTITGLPKKDGEGKTYYYKVIESEITGYATSYLNDDATDESLQDKTDALYSGGTVENAAKIGPVKIQKKFVDSEGNNIPKAALPDGFKIKVKYVWFNPETKKFETINNKYLTIGDKTADDDGFYTWTIDNVAYATKVTAEEIGYKSPTGYSYVSTTADVSGDNPDTHPETNPTYAEFTMPSSAATITPGLRSAVQPGDAAVIFTNTYTRNTGTIEPVKIWDDNSNAAGKRPETVTFTITAKSKDGSAEYAIFDDGQGGKKSSMTFTFAGAGAGEGNSDIWTMDSELEDQIKNLPTHTDNGNQIKYVVEEKDADVPTGYQRLYPQAALIEITLNTGDVKKAEITNAYRELVITKQWLDVDGKTTSPTTKRPSADLYKNMVKLYADGVVKTDIEPEVTDNEDGTYTIKWEGLPKNAGTSVFDLEIAYTAKEDPDTITGYAKGTYSNVENPDTAAREANVKDKALNGGTITNNQLVKVDVVKEWKDNHNHDGQRPDKIKVTLYQNGVEYKPEGESSAEKELTEATATPGTSAEGNDTWTWTSVWTNLPYADANGSVYNYTATETGMGDSEGLWGVLTNAGTIRQILLQTWNTPVKDTLTFNITNDDVEDKTGFTVDKIWKDGSDVDKLRPATINYRLYQAWAGHDAELVKELPEGAEVKTVTNGAEPVDADYANGYVSVDAKKTDTSQGTLNRVIFSGLPEFAASGKKITYTIKEDGDVSNDAVSAETVEVTIDPIRGYNIDKDGQMPVIGGSQTVGYTVTNEHTPVSAEETPKAVKKITGRTFKLGEDFTFKLAVDENSPKNTPTPTPDWVTIKADATDALGKTMDIPLGTFKFTGADMTDKLKAGDTKTFTYKLTEVNGGKTIDDLKYDASEKTLKITVKRNADGTIEIPEEGGVVWGDGSEGSDTFTNVYGATTKLILRKVWIDEDADNTVIGTRPEKVKFTLTATIDTEDGVWETDAENKLITAGFTKDVSDDKKYTQEYELKTSDVTAESNIWQIKTADLPKYDAVGDEIKFAVSEDQIPNYEEPTVIAENNVYTVTNEYVRDGFTGTKVWNDGGQTHDNTVELKDKLVLHRDWTDESGETSVEMTEEVEDFHIDWDGDNFNIIGLPEYTESGEEYTYWVSEETPGGYSVSYTVKTHGDEGAEDGIKTGGKIVNTPKVGDAEIVKKFVDDDGNIIPKDALPASFKIKVEYQAVEKDSETGELNIVTKNENKTVNDDDVEYDSDNGTYTWVLEDVAYNTKVTAEEEGFEYASGDAKGYTYVETETTVKGKSGSEEIHSEESPTYAETVMPLNVAVNEPDRADDNECSITFVNKYERDRGSLNPAKVWDDESNRDNLRPDSVKFKITAKAGDPEESVNVFDDGEDGKTSSLEVEFTKDNNGTDDEWTMISATDSSIDDLPLATETGEQITYYVQEENVPTSYTCTESTKSTALTKDEVTQVKITNSYTPKSGQFAPTKEWKGDNNDALQMRRDTHLYLYKQVADSEGTYGDKMLVSVKDYALVKKDSETIDITDWGTSLPAYENGYPIRYTVAEETVPGYTTTYEYKRDTETRNWAELVLTQNQETGAVTVTPDSIKVINTFDPEFNELAIEKNWVDNDDREGYRPDEITVTVSAELADKTAALVFDDGGTKKSTKTYTLKASEDWKKTIAASANEFPMKWNGEQVYYFVTEQADFENSDKYNAKRNNKAIIERTDQGEFTLTNVHEIETGCVEAEKVWEDADNQDGKRSAVTFKLYADGQPAKYVDGSAVPDKTISADISTPQSAAWHDLPVYKTDGTGAKVTYTVVESGAASGYTTTYSPAAGVQLAKDGDVKKITVTNSYTPETVDVEATKVWAGETDATDTKFRGNNKVKLHLYGKADGKIVFDAGEKTVNDSLTVDKNGTCTTVEWSDQPKYHEGDELTWVVEEEPIPGYTCAITGDAEDGFTVTNTFVPTTVVKATKVWNDENNRDGKRADVTVKLIPFVDGAKKEDALDDSYTLEKTIEVNASAADGADAGTATWTDLPIETSDHKAITYVVSETSKPNGYTSKVIATDKAGEYKIENSYTPETIDVEVEKTWDDSSNAAGTRPDHIEITLKADGTTVETVLVTGSGNKWSHEFTDLPKNKADGSGAITYTVDETSLPGYTTTYDPADKSVSGADGKVKITNTIKKGVVYVLKTWNDNNDHDGKRPTAREFAGKVHLYADGEQLNVTPTTSASGNTFSLTFDDLAVYNTKGELITYMVVEDSIADYTQTGTITPSGSMDASKAKPDLTLSLANKHDSSTDITGTKVWRDGDKKHNNQTEVKLTVMRQADGGDPEKVDDAHIDWDGDNYTVTGLPVFDEDGNKYTYWVVETAIDGYEDPVYDNSKSTGTTDAQKAEADKAYNGGKIINSALTSITLTKKWDDAKYFEGEAADIGEANEYKRPDVTFTVTATATTTDEIKALTDADFKQDETTKTKYTKEVPLSGETDKDITEWTETIYNLPMFDQAGEKIKYVATEESNGVDATPEGFIKDEGEEDTEVSNKPKEDEKVNTLDLTIKKEDGATDTHEGLNGAEFTIYLSNGETPASEGTSGAVASNKVTTSGSGDDAGKASVTFQKPGTYVIKETKAPKGYALSEKSFTVQVDKKLKSITLKEEANSFWEWLHDLFFNEDGSTSSMTGNVTQGFTLTVNDEPIRAEVLVEKVWDDEDDQDGLRGDATEMPKVKLQYKIGETEWKDATGAILGEQDIEKQVPEEDGKVSGGKNYTWNELPAYIDGEEVTYRVVEEGKIPEYEDPIYSKESFTLANSGGTKAENAEVSVTNTYEPATAKVQVSKKWADNNNLDELRVDELTFRLISDGDFENSKDLKIDTDVDDGDEAIKTPDDAIWLDLPVYKDGKKIRYTLTETTKIDGYTVEYDKKNVKFELDPDSEDPYLVTVTNKHTPDAVRVWVKKEWMDNNNQDGMRGEVTIRLAKADGSQVDWDVKDKDGNDVTDLKLNSENNYRGKFDNLKAVDEDGKTIKYTVKEIDAPEGYDIDDADISGTGTHTDPFVVTNIRDVDTVSVKAVKKWYGDTEFKEDTRKDVTLHLIGRKGDGMAWDGGSQTITVNMDADEGEEAGDVTWTRLPRNIDGEELVWEVYEDAVPGYAMALIGSGTADEDGNVEFEVVNSYVGAVAEVTAVKQWRDDNNRDDKRTDVWFQLYRTIGYDGTEEAVGNPKKVDVDKTASDGDDAGKVTWKDLPEIIEETETEYRPAHTKEGDSPKDLGWYEKIDQDEYVLSEDEFVDRDKEYFERFDTSTERAVIYTVKEVDADGNVTAPDDYDSIVTQTSAGEFVVINVHVPDTTDLSVQKIWDDGNDNAGLRPDHLKIRLKDGDETVREVVLTDKDEGDGWNSGIYTFTGLIKNEDGEPIDYKIVELDSDEDTELDGSDGHNETSYGYTVSIQDEGRGSAENPVVITNSYEGGGESSLTVTKKWEGDAKHKNTRGDVKLHLIKVIEGARSVVEDEDKIIKFDPKNPDKAMTAEWTGLTTMEKGKSVVYTVEEFDVPAGYRASVGNAERDDDNNYTVTVTNTYSETPVFGEDVIFIDPLNPAGKMALKSTTYDTHAEAQAAANNKTGAPANPKHSGYKFTGWAVNYDTNGNFVLVATYSQKPVKENTTSYIDPQSGEPLLVSEVTDNPSSVKPPKDPKHPNLVFKGWKKVKDASGNTIYVAEYGCECSNGSPNPKSVDKSKVNTGDENMLYVWIWILLLSAVSFVLTAMMRNRSFSRTDGYKPRH